MAIWYNFVAKLYFFIASIADAADNSLPYFQHLKFVHRKQASKFVELRPFEISSQPSPLL